MKSDCMTQKKEWVLVSIIVPLLVLFLLCLNVGVFTAKVMAQDHSRGMLKEVVCGEELGPEGHYKLANDLLCPCDPKDQNVKPALTIVGPVTVDLNGRSIACEPCKADQCEEGNTDPLYSIVGIQVKGERATVRNGTIIRCNVGLVVGEVADPPEEGHHKIFNVRVLANQEVLYLDDEDKCNNFKGDGIVFESTDNIANGNEILGNQNDGIDLKAGFNSIKNNTSIGNGGRGYKLDGDHNWLIKNQARINVKEGIEIDNGVGIRVINNRATANGKEGIKVGEGAQDGSIKFNKAIANGKGGIVIKEGATDNSVISNKANANEKEGIKVEEKATYNAIIFNKAIDNGKEGIVVEEDATDNSIIFNKAILNGKDDLRDKHENCDNNTWRWNTFDTKNPECIQ